MQGHIAKINGVSLWYTVQGEGIPFVLLHGGPGAYDYMEPVADLVGHGYQVIRYDQRGSWRSEKKGPYDVETFVEDLEQLRVHLGLDRWIVGGHSWGASLALAYAAQYNARTKALIYISGTGINQAWHAEYRINRLNNMSDKDREEYTSLRSVVESMTGEQRERTKVRIRELSLRADLYDQEQYSNLPRADGPLVNAEVNQKVGSNDDEYVQNKQFEKAISKITAPSLFVHGEADPRPYKYANELADQLPNSEFKLIRKAGHYPWLDHPAALREEIHAFLDMQL